MTCYQYSVITRGVCGGAWFRVTVVVMGDSGEGTGGAGGCHGWRWWWLW